MFPNTHLPILDSIERKWEIIFNGLYISKTKLKITIQQ